MSDRCGGADPKFKHAVVTRLRRIEGQVRGIEKVVTMSATAPAC